MNSIPVRDAHDLEKKQYKWYRRGFHCYVIQQQCQCNEIHDALLVIKDDRVILSYVACQQCFESYKSEFCEYEPDKTEAA